MSRHILLISYDDRLLIARRTLLEQEGYRVSSALGFREAVRASGEGSFDLLILGHSIPRADHEELIRVFRAVSDAPILSLWTHKEGVIDGINYLAFSDTPNKLLANVAAIFARRSGASA
jgi:DNA-binding response OmpR family regulator